MSTDETTVLVVDDDNSIRQGVARLARATGLGVHTFKSAEEFFKQPLPTGPACVVLDYCMDGLNGLEIQEVLQQNGRNIPVVFLSGHGSVPVATTAMKRGADDFIEKPYQPNALMTAIQRALERDRRQLSDREDRDEVTHCYLGLTAREREVMALVIRGKLNKQVAHELGISEKTVKVHRGRVMEKMQVDSLAELVTIAGKVDYPSKEPATAHAGKIN